MRARSITARLAAGGLLAAGMLCATGQLLGADTRHPYEAASTGWFRDQDTLPGSLRIYEDERESRFWGLGPGGGRVSRQSFSADAHEGVEGYGWQRCVSCHESERHSLHESRGNVTCVQCHRDEPISGINHYYSAMNPIRRHAYVCAKCHEGASASFATYVIHEPSPLAAATREAFPLLHYAVWFMVILAGGVFVIFLPYVTLWGVRELVAMRNRGKRHG